MPLKTKRNYGTNPNPKFVIIPEDKLFWSNDNENTFQKFHQTHSYFFFFSFFSAMSTTVKYSLADNMGQGKNPTVPSQSDAPEESDLWTAWQLFPLGGHQTCHSKDGGSAYSVGQLWEEIAGAWRRVHISAWEFDGNIRPTNWTEDSEKFRCSRKLVPSLPRVPHRRTIQIPLLIAPTSHKRPSRK